MSFDFEIEPTLNKEYLLSKYSEETYMAHYTGLPIKKGLFLSPLREDHKPSVAFYKNNNGVLLYKDFGDGTCVTFIGFVMKLFAVNYHQAVRLIAEDFGLVRAKTRVPIKKIKEVKQKYEESKPAIINVEVQELLDRDLEWWEQFNVSRELLEKYHVYSCKHVFLNGKIFAEYTDRNPIYGYYFGKKNNAELWKIYMPKRTEWKWICNTNNDVVQGYRELPPRGKICVITKSLKDVLCLKSFGISAIAPNSEHLFISDEMLENLKKRFKKIVILYDNDHTGMRRTVEIRRQHPELLYTLIPKCTGCKDLSDYVKKHGADKARKMIYDYVKWINQTSETG